MRKTVWPVFTVDLGDLVPGIGCGRRNVEAEVGRKWVRVRANARRQAHRLPITVWERLNPVPTAPSKQRKAIARAA